MPRTTRALRVHQFLGEDDATPATIGDQSLSVMENVYKKRNTAVRRKGFSALAASLGAFTVRHLEWYKIGSTEHLLEVDSGDLRDWLHATPGTIVGGGTDILPSSGAADANSAWIDEVVYIGNGLDANVRYNGAEPGLAADFIPEVGGVPQTANGLRVPFAANALFTTPDITVAAWVRFDSVALNLTDTGGVGRVVVASTWDRTTASGRGWRIGLDPNSGRFFFQVRGATGTETVVENTTVTPTVGVWYLLIGQHDAALDRILIKVNTAAAQTAAHTDGLNEPPNVDLHVGSQFNGVGVASAVVDGRVAPVGVWRSAEAAGGVLTTDEIASLYNGGVPLLESELTAAQEDDLIAYWDMTEVSGTRDDDHSAATTFDLLPFGAGVGSAEGPYGQLAVITAGVAQASSIAGPAVFNPGAIPAGTHSYVVTNINADGVHGQESATPFEATNSPAVPRRINVAGIPLGPTGTFSRALWRLDEDSTVYRLVTTITDNTTTSYDDNEYPLTGREVLVEGNTTMPPIRYWAEHNARVVGAGNFTEDDGEQTIYISNKFEPWACPLVPDLENVLHGTRARLQGRAAGATTGVHAHGQFVAIFTGGAGYLLSGDQPYDFALNKFCDHGCAAHRTIRSARDLLIWLGSDSVYAFDGKSVFSISEDQRATIEAMTVAEMAGAHAFIWDDKYFLCWDTGAIVFDLQYKVWSTNTAWLWRDSTVTEFTSGGRERIYGAGVGVARVYQLEVGATDAGTAIPVRLDTKDYDMGAPGREKRAMYMEIRAKKSTGTLAITLKKGSGQTVQTDSHDLATVDHADEGVTRYFDSCVEQARSEFFRLSVTTSTTAAEVELHALGLHFQVVT